MDPITASIAANAAGSLLGGIFSNKKAENDYSPSVKEAIDRINSIHVPTLDEQKALLQKYVVAGVLSPTDVTAILQGQSAYNDINLNPAYRQAQEQALAKLQGIISGGGLDAIDKAKLAGINSNLQQQIASNTKQIQDDAARRGISGSGIELGAEMQGSQQAINAANTAGTNTAALALQRELDAINNAASTGNTMEKTAYQEASDRAKASDIITNYNTQAQNAAAVENERSANRDKELNQNTAQTVSNDNVTTGNTEAVREANLPQQGFNDTLAKDQAPLQLVNNSATAANTTTNSNIAGDNALYSSLLGALGKSGANYFSSKQPAPTPAPAPSTSTTKSAYDPNNEEDFYNA